MNKTVKPIELPLDEPSEPTPTQKRKMLIAGCEDFDAKFKPETAEEAVDNFLAKDLNASARRSGLVFGGPQPADDFDWNNPDEESIVLREQRATAVYRNRCGELIIRQRCWPDDDTFRYLTPENEVTFMEGLAKRAKET
jgi:hypothetical protein